LALTLGLTLTKTRQISLGCLLLRDLAYSLISVPLRNDVDFKATELSSYRDRNLHGCIIVFDVEVDQASLLCPLALALPKPWEVCLGCLLLRNIAYSLVSVHLSHGINF